MCEPPRIITLECRTGGKREIIKVHHNDCPCSTCEKERLRDEIDVMVAGLPNFRFIMTCGRSMTPNTIRYRSRSTMSKCRERRTE